MKREDLFELLDPPPDGLAKLRERMIARPTLLWRVAPPIAALAVAAAVLLFFWSRRDATPDLVASARRHGGTSDVMLGLAPPPATPASLTDDERKTTGLAGVESASPKVAFYWVSKTTWPD